MHWGDAPAATTVGGDGAGYAWMQLDGDARDAATTCRAQARRAVPSGLVVVIGVGAFLVNGRHRVARRPARAMAQSLAHVRER